MGIINDLNKYNDHVGHIKLPNRNIDGKDGIGFKLTEDGDYHLQNKKITNLKAGTVSDDALRKDQIDGLLANKSNVSDTVLRDGSQSMNNNLDMNNKKIINLKDITSSSSLQNAVNLKYVKEQLNLKLDKITFTIANSLPGVPVLDNISIALIPALSVITADSSNKVSSWIDPVNNISFTQSSDSKKPLLLRDSIKKVFFIRFDGNGDFLQNPSFDVSEVAGSDGDTCTVIMVIDTKRVKQQSQFQWGNKDENRFGVHLPWGDGTCYVDFGNVDNGRLQISSLINLTSSIEVWTIRVNGSNIELFRGVSSMNPIQTASITAKLGRSQQVAGVSQNSQQISIGCQYDTNGSPRRYCEMDLYAFACWKKALSDDELKNMFRFLENYFDL